MNIQDSTFRGRRTPYNDQYETCERTLVMLRVYGDNLDPEDVTRKLGLVGSSSQKKGQVFTNSMGRERTARIGGWFLTSEGTVVSNDLRRHLDWLIERLLPHAKALRDLQHEEGIVMDVNCIWWSKHGDGGPTLWPEQMCALADLNLELGFELALFGENEEDLPRKNDPQIPH